MKAFKTALKEIIPDRERGGVISTVFYGVSDSLTSIANYLIHEPPNQVVKKAMEHDKPGLAHVVLKTNNIVPGTKLLPFHTDHHTVGMAYHQGESRETVMNWAVSKGHAKLVETLLRKDGCDRFNLDKLTLKAAGSGYTDIVDIFQREGVNVKECAQMIIEARETVAETSDEHMVFEVLRVSEKRERALTTLLGGLSDSDKEELQNYAMRCNNFVALNVFTEMGSEIPYRIADEIDEGAAIPDSHSHWRERFSSSGSSDWLGQQSSETESNDGLYNRTDSISSWEGLVSNRRSFDRTQSSNTIYG